MIDATDVTSLSVSALSKLISGGEASPVEVTQAYLDRVRRLDGRLHSFITLDEDGALDQARSLEQEQSHNRIRGPLHGVPMGVKDHCHVAGLPTTEGSEWFRDCVADHDSTVVARLKERGAILLGKLNMSELGIGYTIDWPFGRTNNPWDLKRTPGTSSAGPGAATCASLCAASLGGDTGGSIRIPASYCGISGLRPTWGLVSRYGIPSIAWSMDTTGPMAKTVEDCAIVLQAIAGRDPKDSYTRDWQVPDYRGALDGGISGLRVGVVREVMDTSVSDAEVVKTVRRAVGQLERLGASVEEVSLPSIVHVGAVHWAICFTEFATIHQKRMKDRAEDLTKLVKIATLAGALLPAQGYYKATWMRDLIRREVLDALKRYDILVTPTTITTAEEWAETYPEITKEYARNALTSSTVVCTGAFSHAGTPALSIPCGFTEEGLPVGLQIVGKPFDDALVLRVGYTYQQETDWHTRRPPLE